jgi:hypothetical protein
MVFPNLFLPVVRIEVVQVQDGTFSAKKTLVPGLAFINKDVVQIVSKKTQELRGTPGSGKDHDKQLIRD